MAAKRYLGLDGLRGVCAITVLLYHCSNFFLDGPACPHGYLAVDVFFILSGFVIALNYEERLRAGGHAAAFLLSRARRLFPTYWLGAVLNVGIFLFLAATGILFPSDKWWMVWLFIPLSTLFMVPDFITSDGTLYPGMEGVSWSLFLEWIAYGLYASGIHRWKTEILLLVSMVGWFAMALLGYYTGDAWSAGGTRPTFFTIGLLRCLPAFAMGIVIYRVHSHRLFRRLPELPIELLLLVWLVIATLPARAPTPTFDAFVVPLACPFLIVMLIRSEAKSPKYCKYLGAISYPLYVAHPGIILLAHFTNVFGRFDRPNPLHGLVVVILCIFAALLIMQGARILGRTKVRLRSPFREAAALPG